MSTENKDSTVAAAAPRPQFKKLKKKNKPRLRSREEENDEHDSSAMDAIEQTKKKRKLLNEVLYKKGLDVTLKASSDVAATVESTTSAKETDDGTDRLRSFAGEGGDATAEGGVLQRKHKSAMEEFIQENLKQQNVVKEQEETTAAKSDTATDKLYAELASESQKLAGSTSTIQSGEGDVGAGGAMLGGTGIAEVTLPADDRIQTIRETQVAVSSFPATGSKRSSAVPHDFAYEMSGTDDISNVPSSYSHNFQLHTQEWAQQKQQEEVLSSPVNQREVHDDSQGDRMGFEAARRVARGDASTTPSRPQEKNRSNDDRAWKNFMKKQQQSRDRY